MSVPSVPGRMKWRFKLGGDYALHSQGVGADGTVYVSLSNGKLYAIAPDGTQRWVVQAGLGGGVPTPVAVGSDGTIYVGGLAPDPSGTGRVEGIFAVTSSGTQKWVFVGTKQMLIAGPSVGPDGNIYAVTRQTGIGLFSVTPQGQLRFSTGQFGQSGPLGEEIAFGSGQLYVAFDMWGTGLPPTLFAYDLSGNKRFQATGTGTHPQPVVGPNGNVVLQTVSYGLVAYAPSGAQAWSFWEFPGNTEENPDVGPDNNAYTVRNLSTLLALDATGRVRWRYVDPGILFEPRVRPGNDLLFMGGRVGYGQPGFFLGVGINGTPLWRVDLPDEPGFSPYGQLVPMTRPVFSPDGKTAYAVTDVAGDGASTSPYSFLYAIDVSPTAAAANTTPRVSLVASTATTIHPGGTITVRGSFTDPDAGDGPWQLNFRWGNGQTFTTMAAPGTITRSRIYSTIGTYSIRLRVTDARGAIGVSNAVMVTVQ